MEETGHFRIYLGAAAGVGKTVAMLDEGKRRFDRGADVVVGYVECHGRPRTVEKLDGLEVLMRKQVSYRETQLEEMDLPALLTRAPAVALVDELAHTNVPGSGPHKKRWQDIVSLLDEGIDVITTVNIQHLESIADAVEQITGTRVRERVPDWVVRSADQIELVDSSPEQLRRRMLHGNIYPPEKVSQALNNFFKTDNLVALRELALRFLADETEEELLEHLGQRSTDRLWETTERILVGATLEPGSDALLRRAARIASRTKGELHVLHVHEGEGNRGDRSALQALQQLALAVGGRWHETADGDASHAIVAFARAHQITQIVVGTGGHNFWKDLFGGSTVRRLQRLAGDAGIDVHVIARRTTPTDLQADGGDE